MKQWLGSFFKMSDVLDELLAGILLYGILCNLILFLFGKAGLYHSCGLWIGILLAVIGSFHITWSLDKVLDLGEEGAVKKMRAYSLLRYGVVLIVLGVLMIVNKANPLTAFLGLMGLKISAYVQPFVHKAAVRAGLKKEIVKPLLSPEEVDELIRLEKGKEPKADAGDEKKS